METLKQRILGRGLPDPSTGGLELCEIEVSKDGDFHVKPHEEAKILLNGCEVRERTALFHEDWIQLEGARPWCKSMRRVGIFFWDADTEVNWLIRQLISKNTVSVSCLALSEASDQFWRSAPSQCSTIIFCHSMRSKKPWYDMEGYLGQCLQSHGPDKVLMAITDLEDAMCEKGMRAQWTTSKLSECDLLLFTEKEMNLLIQQRLTTESQIMEAKLNQIKCILQERVTGIRSSNRPLVKSCRKHIVGIFSKSTKNCFVWLKNLLTSTEKFKDLVQDVRLFHNVNIKDQKVLWEISLCTFLILYHSKKHGEAKITDVSGAFYKEELEYLSDAVGKDNTIVVIDDMVNNRSGEKMKILQEQPSIQRLVLDLFLFGVKEKDKRKMEEQKIKEKLETVNSLITGRESKSRRVPVHERKMEESTDHQPQRQDGHISPMKKNGPKPMWPLLSDEAPLQMLNDNSQKVGCDREGRTTPRLPRIDSRPVEPMPEIISETIIFSGGQQRRLSTRPVVGIFSRSPQRDYYWLRDVLQMGCDHVLDIRHSYMLDSGSLHQMQVVTECTFGILYHKKTTGKFYITDVPGSLYDKELRYLSEQLGQKNVFVVVDNVEDPSLEKLRILAKQPSINTLTRGLEVFGRDKGDLLEDSSQIKEIIKHFGLETVTRDGSSHSTE